MIEIDVPDLVVITGQVLGISTDAALSQLDIPAAKAALTDARHAGQEAVSAAARSRRPRSAPAGERPHRAAAGAAAVALMHALLRHPPLPGHSEQVAAAAGLQFLAVNGWQANLDVPGAAASAIKGLASGQLSPADAASWFEVRLSPHPASPERDSSARALLQPRSRARQIVLAPVAAVRHRQHRRSGRGPFLVTLGSADKPAGIRTPATGLMPFSGAARDLVVRSGHEARRRGQLRGSEHFLLALTGDSFGVAVKALERLGITREAVRRQTEQLTGQGQPQAPPGWIPDTAQAGRLWPVVLDEAVAHGDDYIGTQHFLLALYSDSDTAAAQALARLSAGESEVRSVIAALLAESGPERLA
jgi:Clp amino terminal domain, pathogenicity island component